MHPADDSRWPGLTDPEHSRWYIERFRAMAARGDDLEGEARFVDAMVPRGARILDAGCGPGRVASQLHARGHAVVGVDVDPLLIEAAAADHPGPRWLVSDLDTLDLGALGETEPFDAAVLAGNVMPFLVHGSGSEALRRIGAAVHPDGLVVVGFQTRRLPLEAYEASVTAAGLRVEHRFATWQLGPWAPDAEFLVSVLRHA